MNIKKSILFSFFLVFVSFLHCTRQKMIISVSVSDLRTQPILPEYKKTDDGVQYPLLNPYIFDVGDKLQDSQLLLNDKLFFIEFADQSVNWINVKGDDWIKVEVAEQKRFENQRWEGLTGYVQFQNVCLVDDFVSSNLVVKNHLTPVYLLPFDSEKVNFHVSIGTKFRCKHIINYNWLSVDCPFLGLGYIKREDLNIILDEHIYGLDLSTRSNICLTAETFLNFPYSWGGRSSFDKNNKKQQTGVDCSAFVNLVYRANGFEVPRNAHDQFEFCEKIIYGKSLEKGDLIFFESEKRNGRMSHVLMYFGKNKKGKSLVIEVTGFKPFKTRKIIVRDLLGENLNRIKAGEEFNGHVVYFGSFLNNSKKIQEMRTLFKVGKNNFLEKGNTMIKEKKWFFSFLLFSFLFNSLALTVPEFSKDGSDLVDVTKVNKNICVDIRYTTADNFTKQVLYSCAKAYLRKKVAGKLDKVQKDLEVAGLGLKVWDAYRPLSAQIKMWEVKPDANYVANPERGSKHNRGASVDVTLVNLKTGKELKMPTEFDDFTDKSKVAYNDGTSDAAQQNRDFLQHTMTRNGFLSYKNEWWHFNDSEWETYPLLDIDFEDLN